MSQQQSFGAPMLLAPDAQLVKLGQAMKELQKWWWLGICLFFLIIPPIVLFVKYIQYIIALGEVKRVENDEEMNKTFTFLLVAFICSLVSAPLYGTAVEYITGILGFVFSILSVISFEKWAMTFNQRKQSVNSANFLKAIQDLKMANILMIIIIGIFLFPGAIGRAGDSLLAEHGVISPSYQASAQGQQIGYSQQPSYQAQPNYSQQTYAQPTATFGATPSYSPGNTTQPPAQANKAKFCPHCGNQLPPDAKFCGKCGGSIVL